MNKTTSLQKNYSLNWFSFNEKYNTIVAELKDKVAAMQDPFSVRKIKLKDNPIVKDFIQKNLIEKGGVGFDQLYYDTDLIDLYTSFSGEGESFWVLTHKEEILGTIGLRMDSVAGVALMTKFYLKMEASDHAISLINVAQSFAKRQGAKLCTLKTEMKDERLNDALTKASFELSKTEHATLFYTCQL